jgi:hypothetical protein
MQVPEHSIGPPAAQQFDGVIVTAAIQEGHGATSAQRASLNIRRLETDGQAQGRHGKPEQARNITTCNA